MPQPESSGRRTSRALLTWGLISCVFAWVWASTFWLGDDAFITFRVVENLVAGQGMRWNIAERVQASSSPLWVLMLALVRVMTTDAPMASQITSAVACGLLLHITAKRLPPTTWAVWVFALISCRSVLDFAASGLEMPLVFLLIGVLLMSRSPPLLVLGISAVPLVRMDLAVFALPIALLTLHRSTHRLSTTLALLLPATSWSVFAWFYFGSPFGNPAIAKYGFDSAFRFHRVLTGLSWLKQSLAMDPVLTWTLGLSAVVLLREIGTRSLAPRTLAVLAGALLYTTSLVCIGGDFMAGRLLGPTWIAITLAAAEAARPADNRLGAMVLAAAVTHAALTATPLPWSYVANCRAAASSFGVSRVEDERAVYAKDCWPGLVSVPPGAPLESGAFAVLETTNVGLKAYLAGPSVHVFDKHGLTDARIARTAPIAATDKVGHAERRVPDWMLEAIASEQLDVSTIRSEPGEQQFIEWTRGDLSSASRLRSLFVPPRDFPATSSARDGLVAVVRASTRAPAFPLRELLVREDERILVLEDGRPNDAPPTTRPACAWEYRQVGLQQALAPDNAAQEETDDPALVWEMTNHGPPCRVDELIWQ